jgi:hypothetical protein
MEALAMWAELAEKLLERIVDVGEGHQATSPRCSRAKDHRISSGLCGARWPLAFQTVTPAKRSVSSSSVRLAQWSVWFTDEHLSSGFQGASLTRLTVPIHEIS